MTSQQLADVSILERKLNRIAFGRIAEIDAMFDMSGSGSWGSWMVSCANERESLVNAINSRSGQAVHRYQARCNGRKTS